MARAFRLLCYPSRPRSAGCFGTSPNAGSRDGALTMIGQSTRRRGWLSLAAKDRPHTLGKSAKVVGLEIQQ